MSLNGSDGVCMVVLGGTMDPPDAMRPWPNSLGMRQFMLDLGVPAVALLTEERSRNTRENAEMSARLLRAQDRVLFRTDQAPRRRDRVQPHDARAGRCDGQGLYTGFVWGGLRGIRLV